MSKSSNVITGILGAVTAAWILKSFPTVASASDAVGSSWYTLHTFVRQNAFIIYSGIGAFLACTVLVGVLVWRATAALDENLLKILFGIFFAALLTLGATYKIASSEPIMACILIGMAVLLGTSAISAIRIRVRYFH